MLVSFYATTAFMPILPRSYLGYFVTRKQLVEVFLDCNSDLGGIDKDDMDATLMARRSIFQYLMPGRISVWFDATEISGEVVSGMTFMISHGFKREKILKDLLEHCRDMFLDDPGEFVLQENPKWDDCYIYDWKRDGKVIGTVEILDFQEYVIAFVTGAVLTMP